MDGWSFGVLGAQIKWVKVSLSGRDQLGSNNWEGRIFKSDSGYIRVTTENWTKLNLLNSELSKSNSESD